MNKRVFIVKGCNVTEISDDYPLDAETIQALEEEENERHKEQRKLLFWIRFLSYVSLLMLFVNVIILFAM